MDPRGEEALEAALAYAREGLGTGALGRFAPLFERAKLEAADGAAEAFGDGLEAFLPDAARWARRYGAPAEVFADLPLAPNLACVWFYRVSHALYRRGVARLPDVLAALARWATGVEIYYSARCGPSLKVIHGLGTVIGAGCEIGSHFTAYHGVTIGDRIGARSGLDRRPVIGDHVVACAGAAILGPVRVGDHTIVAANSVVLDSLPSRCIAAGAPARVKVENLSDERFQQYWESFRG
jgi:serine O-acetyltransferase